MGRAILSLLGQRLVQAGLVAWVVGSLTYLLTRALPGDMSFRIAAGRYGYEQVNAEAAAAVQQELGLDQSPLAAYFQWLMDLASFDLGRSLVSGETVVQELSHQLGHSLSLALTAVVMALVLGLPLGLASGLRPGRWLDRVSLALALGLRSLPPFVVGIALVVLFSLTLHWLPAAGHGSLSHLWLPSLALGLGLAAVSSRVARNAMADVAGSDYYAFSRLKGLSGWQTLRRHGLRNLSVPVVAFLGVQLVYLIEGVVVIESLFAWPGIGHALVHAVVARDVPMIQGTALVLGLGFVLLNTLVDIATLLLDPRRRLA
ncbi:MULTISPECIES: ABC transporter permease [unclassified Halomonas]|uniref:ABC transporter permease n=1 Tax=unclassified Halomonas TaxID=2609666 RepID=UPI001C95074E|nr:MULTISPECIES: ABC transporter permease [unclassified Halomonas]MBY5924150.1 ABC transporter permease [Halomonas sp. DP4Y7-2]MBY6231192.1 ABC transporter permease [Halomonas sp. DP4Y7-1]